MVSEDWITWWAAKSRAALTTVVLELSALVSALDLLPPPPPDIVIASNTATIANAAPVKMKSLFPPFTAFSLFGPYVPLVGRPYPLMLNEQPDAPCAPALLHLPALPG